MTKSLAEVAPSPLKTFEMIRTLQDERLSQERGIVTAQKEML